jgi:hypothetical protein
VRARACLRVCDLETMCVRACVRACVCLCALLLPWGGLRAFAAMSCVARHAPAHPGHTHSSSHNNVTQ